MMLGPMKRKMITVGVVTFIIPCVLFGVLFGLYSSKKNDEINALNDRVADGKRYGFATDLPINHVVTWNDLVEIEIKSISAPYNSYGYANGALVSGESMPISPDEIVGRKLKIPVSEKTIAIESMFFADEDNVKNDVRSKEYNTILLPSDLEVGDVVDIRITFPTGEDFIVAVGKEVKAIGSSADSSTVFFDMSEEEIHNVGAALIESYMSDSVRIYAVKYVNPNQQLVDEYHVDYVAKYEDALVALIDEAQEIENARAEATKTPVINDSGDLVVDEKTGEQLYDMEEAKVITASDISVDEIAERAGISVAVAKRVQKAIEENDEVTLRNLSNEIVTVSTELEPTYPVNKEVAALLARNPNLVDDIKRKYNDKIAILEEERANLLKKGPFVYVRNPDGSYSYSIDYETGTYEEDVEVLTAIATKLTNEIDTQKAERQAYLQGLLQQSIISNFN